MSYELGPRAITRPGAAGGRINMLLWGKSGTGKTTLAATAPGTKLWINFDPEGTMSVAHRDDIQVLDLSGDKNSVVEEFKKDDPLKLSKAINEMEIDTIVVDSLSTYGDMALAQPPCSMVQETWQWTTTAASTWRS